MTTADLQEAAARVYLAVGRLSRSLRRTGAPGLSYGQVSALATLVNCGPMRLGDLATKEGVAPPTLSRIVALLVEMGYARREPDPQDGRAWIASATDDGETMISEMRSTRMRELRRRIGHLTEDQRQALIDALPVLEELVGDGDVGHVPEQDVTTSA